MIDFFVLFKVQLKFVFQYPSHRQTNNSEPCWAYLEEHVICIPLVIPMPSHSFTFSIEKVSFEGLPQSVNQIWTSIFSYSGWIYYHIKKWIYDIISFYLKPIVLILCSFCFQYLKSHFIYISLFLIGSDVYAEDKKKIHVWFMKAY